MKVLLAAYQGVLSARLKALPYLYKVVSLYHLNMIMYCY